MPISVICFVLYLATIGLLTPLVALLVWPCFAIKARTTGVRQGLKVYARVCRWLFRQMLPNCEDDD